MQLHVNYIRVANHAIKAPRAGTERIGGTMRSPEISGESPAAPNVLLLLSSALGLWAVIIVTTVSLWPRHPTAHLVAPSAAPQVAHEARLIKIARAPAPTQVRSLKRTKVPK